MFIITIIYVINDFDKVNTMPVYNVLRVGTVTANEHILKKSV